MLTPKSCKCSGVYRIVNTVSGKVYVGSAAHSLAYRCKSHRGCLNQDRHPNRHLQSSWNKHGSEAFEFQILEKCDSKICIEREQFWIDWHLEGDFQLFNICLVAGSQLGTKRSEEFCKANGDRGRGRKLSPEVIEARRQSQIGQKRTGQALQNLREAQNRPEVKAKVREGLASSEKNQLRLSSMKGKFKHTDEAKRKMSLARKGVPKTEEFKRKLSEAKKGHSVSPETRAKISATLKARRVSQ